MAATQTLPEPASGPAAPRWDMTPIFPSPDSALFREAFERALVSLRGLSDLFDRIPVRRRLDGAVDEAFAEQYNEVTKKFNALMDEVRTLGAYLGCFVTTDARDELARSQESLLDSKTVRLDQLFTRYVAWVGSSDTEALLRLSETARAHEYQVRRAAHLEKHQMSENEEDLAAELRPSAISGWARLHGTISALLTATISVRGEEKILPMSSVRSLGNDPDRETRRAAFEAELRAWETVEIPLAACLNGVKGFQQTIRRRRGYTDDVEPTLLANSIDRATLEAMQAACVEAFPDFRSYMKSKAAALGQDKLAWFDISAPMGSAGASWSWSQSEAFLVEHFGAYSDRLAQFAAGAFRDRWIDAEPRVGKEGGAYCSGIRPGESRIMMNFDSSFTSVSTLAHELGHAYHNLNLKGRTPLQRRSPSTLGETASIFCETLAFEAAVSRADRDQRLMLLDNTLQRDLMVVVDIYSRFLFEKWVFERRASRDLTVSEFKELMLQSQRETYGEIVEPLHPYMWAVKGHYYGPTFYNYSYTFGLLFGLGLYAYYKKDPDGFRSRYDDFLSSTALADARSLGQRFGLDVTGIEFWRSSLDVIRHEIAEFQQLVA